MNRRGVYMSVYENVNVDVEVDLTQATEEQLVEALAVVRGAAEKEAADAAVGFVDPVIFTVERHELQAIRTTYLRGNKAAAEAAMERLICDALGTAI